MDVVIASGKQHPPEEVQILFPDAWYYSSQSADPTTQAPPRLRARYAQEKMKTKRTKYGENTPYLLPHPFGILDLR